MRGSDDFQIRCRNQSHLLSIYKKISSNSLRASRGNVRKELCWYNYSDVVLPVLLRVRESASVSIGCQPLYCGRIKSTNPNLTLIFRPYRLRPAISDLEVTLQKHSPIAWFYFFVNRLRLIIDILKRISLILLQVIIFMTSPQIASRLYGTVRDKKWEIGSVRLRTSIWRFDGRTSIGKISLWWYRPSFFANISGTKGG